MIRTAYVRAPLERVLAVLDSELSREGLVRTAAPPPRVVELPRGSTIALEPDTPIGGRRFLLRAAHGWVTVADDPHATTEWGALLSAQLDATVFTLEGEADHVFYSSIVVHEGGARIHESRVPEDAIHEADGRHRIRPRFLAKYFPDAAVSLEAGIVVRSLGGEEDVRAVAEVLGLPNALLEFESVGVVAHDFVAKPGRDVAPDNGGATALAQMVARLAADPEVDMAALGFVDDPAALIAAVSAPTEMPVELYAPNYRSWGGFVGDAFVGHTTFCINGAQGAVTTGLSLRIRGNGRALLAATAVRVRCAGGIELSANLTAKKGDLVASLPEVTFKRTPKPPRHAAYDDPANVDVYLSGPLVAAGSGRIEILGRTRTADGTNVKATAHFDLKVELAPRTPLLPASFDTNLPERRINMRTYAQREFFCGWLALDRRWSEVGDVVTGMVADLISLFREASRDDPKPAEVADEETEAIESFSGDSSAYAGFRADVRRSGGEWLDFRAPVESSPGNAAWEIVRAELARGADVTLTSTRFRKETRIEVSHQPEGSNYVPSEEREPMSRFARIVVSWSSPRPPNGSSRAAMAALATDLLIRAGNVERQLGGIVFASGSPLHRPDFTTPYEGLIDRGRVTQTSDWLANHVRSPGHRVLVPSKAAARLGPPSVAVLRTSLAHGVLLASRAPDPWTYSDSDAEAMEREVLPLLN